MKRLACLLGGFVLLCLALYAFWLEPSSLRLSSYDVPQRAPELKGLRIAVISDLHGGAPYIDTAKIDRVVAMTNAARPDLILLAGDYVTTSENGHRGSHYMAIETSVQHLKALHAPLGVYAVLGNHDRWESAHHIAAVLRNGGILVLENAHVTLATPRGPIGLAGISDFYTRAANVQKALRGMPGPAICFTHSPDVFSRLPQTCALTVAGHTHGGQVWLPLLGRPALNIVSSFGQKYAIGVISEGDKTMFVSSGIGTSGLPVRFGVPPEISLLTLQ